MSFVTWLYGANDLQQQSDALDAQLQAKNNADYGPGGKIYQQIADTQGQQAADATYSQVMSDDTKSVNPDIAGQIDKAFDDSIQSSVSGAVSTVTRPFGDILWGFLKGIPWWLWLIAAGVVFFMTPLPELIFGAAFARKFTKGKA